MRARSDVIELANKAIKLYRSDCTRRQKPPNEKVLTQLQTLLNSIEDVAFDEAMKKLYNFYTTKVNSGSGLKQYLFHALRTLAKIEISLPKDALTSMQASAARNAQERALLAQYIKQLKASGERQRLLL